MVFSPPSFEGNETATAIEWYPRNIPSVDVTGGRIIVSVGDPSVSCGKPDQSTRRRIKAWGK
jgi:hypothetical protein